MAHNGAGYERGADNAVNPFEVLGILPTRDLSLAALLRHANRTVARHVFERDGPGSGATAGPNVPIWSQVNEARQALQEGTFEGHKNAWRGTRLSWNPLAAVGSDAARQPPPTSSSKQACCNIEETRLTRCPQCRHADAAASAASLLPLRRPRHPPPIPPLLVKVAEVQIVPSACLRTPMTPWRRSPRKPVGCRMPRWSS